jgi:hypothetical protein
MHGVPRTAVTSANGAPSRPAGRVQPCRFDLLPPCTPITARQRTRRSDWASRAARIGPLPGDQATVPPQDGARRDQPVRPQPSRQEPDQRGRHRAVGPVPPGPRLGAAQHRDLVPQHEQFRILERRRTTQQDKPASKPHEDQTAQTQRHGRSSGPAATPHLSRQVTAIGRLLAPHRRIAAAHRPGRLLAPTGRPSWRRRSGAGGVTPAAWTIHGSCSGIPSSRAWRPSAWPG